MKTSILVALLIFSATSSAATVATTFAATALATPETKRLTTPRGDELEVTIHEASAKSPTLVVAPGQSCNSKGPLFETIGRLGPAAGFTVVRFEWAYCLKDPSKPAPSAELKNEIEDFKIVLDFAKTLASVDADKITLVGKSLGSGVAHSVFLSNPSVKGLALLTPICSYTTDEAGLPLKEPQRVCEENYPGLKKEIRPVLMAMGDRDSLCLLPILYDYLKDSSGNIQVSVVGGDHGFRMKKIDGSVDDAKTTRNIETVVSGLLNWAGR